MYADNVALPAFARRTPLLQRLYSSKPAAAGLLLLVNAGTDRRTPYRFINSDAHIVQAVPISLILHFSVGLLSIFVVYQTEHRVCVRQTATHCTQRPLLYRRITADALLYARAFQFEQKSFDSIRFDSISQSDKFAACTLIFK